MPVASSKLAELKAFAALLFPPQLSSRTLGVAAVWASVQPLSLASSLPTQHPWMLREQRPLARAPSASRSASDATTSVLQERILELEKQIKTFTTDAAMKQAHYFQRHSKREEELEAAKLKAEQEKQDLEKKVQVLEAAKLKSEQEKQVLEEDKLALQQQVQELLKKIQSAKALLSVQ